MNAKLLIITLLSFVTLFLISQNGMAQNLPPRLGASGIDAEAFQALQRATLERRCCDALNDYYPLHERLELEENFRNEPLRIETAKAFGRAITICRLTDVQEVALRLTESCHPDEINEGE